MGDELEELLVGRESQAYLQSLGISTSDAWTLVKLLDRDATGTVDLQEFIAGCMSLRGTAKAVHVATLAYDQKIAMHRLEELMQSLESRLSFLERPVKSESRDFTL